ncbi:hypothetical protein NECAME_11148 [Necator americanus]|uniref:Uncharacterized protein n=1 Tax=Necator americanus TaxID=51031 RepID=W2T5L6_NECAM|nr:hypothetical protein NECAME_11148 [Necator americanus]ETN77295.1 hypothetical protein NECAME_11148 [Necator americanus]
MWSNTSFDYFRRLRSNIKLQRRRSRSFLYGPGEFNAKVGPRRTPEELHIWTHGLQWNDQGERLSKFIMTTKTIHGNSQFQKPSSLRWTWESPGGGYRSKIDHIIVNKRFCLTDVAAVPKFYTGSDLLRERFSFTRRAEKAAKFRERNPRTIINWDLFATKTFFIIQNVTLGTMLFNRNCLEHMGGMNVDATFDFNGVNIVARQAFSECCEGNPIEEDLKNNNK